jgi:hypothetical protein
VRHEQVHQEAPNAAGMLVVVVVVAVRVTVTVPVLALVVQVLVPVLSLVVHMLWKLRIVHVRVAVIWVSGHRFYSCSCSAGRW